MNNNKKGLVPPWVWIVGLVLTFIALSFINTEGAPEAKYNIALRGDARFSGNAHEVTLVSDTYQHGGVTVIESYDGKLFTVETDASMVKPTDELYYADQLVIAFVDQPTYLSGYPGEGSKAGFPQYGNGIVMEVSPYHFDKRDCNENEVAVVTYLLTNGELNEKKVSCNSEDTTYEIITSVEIDNDEVIFTSPFGENLTFANPFNGKVYPMISAGTGEQFMHASVRDFRFYVDGEIAASLDIQDGPGPVLKDFSWSKPNDLLVEKGEEISLTAIIGSAETIRMNLYEVDETGNLVNEVFVQEDLSLTEGDVVTLSYTVDDLQDGTYRLKVDAIDIRFGAISSIGVNFSFTIDVNQPTPSPTFPPVETETPPTIEPGPTDPAPPRPDSWCGEPYCAAIPAVHKDFQPALESFPTVQP